MSVKLTKILRAGLEFVWGSFRLGKGLIFMNQFRMWLGGFKVDFGSVLVGLELICAGVCVCVCLV